MKKFFLAVFTSLLVLFAAGQNDSVVHKHKIAIFAPLYIDSAFAPDTSYRYAKYVFPKFINPGLEFYEGVQLALDSLNKENAPLEVFVYDTRSATETIQDQLDKPEMEEVELIITYCSSSEVRIFADAGLQKNIPVINANVPNDGNVKANPFFVMLNSTLKTQSEGIYKYIQKNYPLNPVIVFRKSGRLEDRIQSNFDDFSENTFGVPLNIKYVTLTDNFSVDQLTPYLDSAREILCVAGSLDENFGKSLARQLSELQKQNYKSIVMGMPTWDNIREFDKPEYKGIEIIYCTPFYHTKEDKVSQSITNYFNTVMFARPSDMVFRGYEVTWKFARLLMYYGKDLASNLTNNQTVVFTNYDIQPVLNRHDLTLDYFENKNLYFMKWMDGVLKVY